MFLDNFGEFGLIWIVGFLTVASVMDDLLWLIAVQWGPARYSKILADYVTNM